MFIRTVASNPRCALFFGHFAKLYRYLSWAVYCSLCSMSLVAMVQGTTISTLNGDSPASIDALLQCVPQTTDRPMSPPGYSTSVYGFLPYWVGKAKSPSGLWNTMCSGPCGSLISALLTLCFNSSMLAIPILSVCTWFTGRDAHSHLAEAFSSSVFTKVFPEYFLELETPCLSGVDSLLTFLFYLCVSLISAHMFLLAVLSVPWKYEFHLVHCWMLGAHYSPSTVSSQPLSEQQTRRPLPLSRPFMFSSHSSASSLSSSDGCWPHRCPLLCYSVLQHWHFSCVFPLRTSASVRLGACVGTMWVCTTSFSFSGSALAQARSALISLDFKLLLFPKQ